MLEAPTIYTTRWCGYCVRLRQQLDRIGVPYREIDIEQDPAAAAFVASVNDGNHTVPTVLFADGTAASNPSAAEVVLRHNGSERAEAAAGRGC
jgi:mycoredoxin